MGNYGGFWSYVHDDDEAEGGRITKLARDLVSEYELQTGDKIELFLDRDELEWGDEWRSKVDGNLESVAFFIPVLTPRYFMSAECRRELQSFARKAQGLGVTELVLPLLWVRVPGLLDDDTQDDLKQIARRFQWEDWTDLRLEDPGSPEHRKAVSRLADRLAQVNAKLEKRELQTPVVAPSGNGESPGEEAPGILDRLADGEVALANWSDTLNEISDHINTIAEVASGAGEKSSASDARGRGFAGRIAVSRELAHELQTPADAIARLSNKYVSEMHDVDDGIRLMIERIPAELADDPSGLPNFCEWFAGLRRLQASGHTGLESTKEFIEQLASLESMSRDLRPPIRKIRESLTILLEADDVMAEWVRQVDELHIVCEEQEDDDGEEQPL